MRPSSSIEPRPRRPCRKTGFGEAGLTYHGITAALSRASCGRGPDRCSHQATLGRRVLGRVNLIGGEQYPSNPFVFEPDPAHRGSCPMDEQLAEVDISPFADPEQMRLASCGVLAWHKSQPRRELPAILEVRRIAHRRDQGRGG